MKLYQTANKKEGAKIFKTIKMYIQKIQHMNSSISNKEILEPKDFIVPKEFIENKDNNLYIEFLFKINDYEYKKIMYNSRSLIFEYRPYVLKNSFKILNRIEFSVNNINYWKASEILKYIPKSLNQFDQIIEEFKYDSTDRNCFNDWKKLNLIIKKWKIN